MLTCSSNVVSYVSVTVPVYWPWYTPEKTKRGGHGVLTGMWVFQIITLHWATSSAKSQAQIRFAFHFVERNYPNHSGRMLGNFPHLLFTGAQPKAGTGHKMQFISVVFSTLHCEGYIADCRYRWLITSGSAHWLIEILSAILKSTRHGGQQQKDV